jgi:putative aldouronate transport system permease protein
MIPTGFSLEAYEYLLFRGDILRYYRNTVFYAVAGTLINLTVTSMIAYTLTFRDFSGRKGITILLVITMFFHGGLIPTYLLVRSLGLIDTVWAIIIPPAIIPWNVIIFRTFFQTIPDSLKDSAFMDGAKHRTVLFRIIVPLSKPLLATFTLFMLVFFWNDWFHPVIYLRDRDLYPIQMLLRRLTIQLEPLDHMVTSENVYLSRTVKAAAIMITITPILCVYPFLQKYFAKGILIGSIKG